MHSSFPMCVALKGLRWNAVVKGEMEGNMKMNVGVCKINEGEE